MLSLLIAPETMPPDEILQDVCNAFHSQPLKVYRDHLKSVGKILYPVLFVISVYLSSLPVAHLSDAPRRQLLRGIVKGYRKKLLRAPPGS